MQGPRYQPCCDSVIFNMGLPMAAMARQDAADMLLEDAGDRQYISSNNILFLVRRPQMTVS